MNTIDEAYEKSLELLRKLSTIHGFVATIENVANYRRVWARDGVVAGLASLVSKDESLIETFRTTLITLREHQHQTGRIPSNLSVEQKKISYGTTVGRVDATLWYIIGVCRFFIDTKDQQFFADFKESLAKAIFYLECLELNGKGLIYVPQGGDWADEYINDGYILYDEMLYYFAISLYGKCTNDLSLRKKKDFLRETIKINFIPSEKYTSNEHVYHESIYKRLLDTCKPPLPISYFSNHKVGRNTDTFGTSLLLASDILEPDQAKDIREHLYNVSKKKNFAILPAFFPVIQPDDSEWNELERNHLFGFRNKPHEYHNGGLWPLVHGFFIASQGKTDFEDPLVDFAEALKRDDYSFPEYYHGLSHTAEGVNPLGFSAAAYIMAYQSMRHGLTPFGTII